MASSLSSRFGGWSRGCSRTNRRWQSRVIRN